jgi:fatty-acyl-CoA synthase
MLISHTQLTSTTIGELLSLAADRLAGHSALVQPSHGIDQNFHQLFADSQAVARALMAMGLKQGDHVAIFAHNEPPWIYTQFAAAMIGTPLITLNTHYGQFELDYILGHCDAKAAIIGPGLSDPHELIKRLQRKITDTPNRFPSLKHLVFTGPQAPEGVLDWNRFIDAGKQVDEAELTQRRAQVGPLDNAYIQYTSGTTGRPKGAMLTHANSISAAVAIASALTLTPQDRICIPVPFYHCFGRVLGTLAAMAAGASIAPVTHVDPRLILDTLSTCRCTALHGVPGMFRDLLAQLNRTPACDLTALRTGIIAGAPCTISLMKRIVNILGIADIRTAYGQTENSHAATITGFNDPLELRVSTVGRAMQNMEIKLIDPITEDMAEPDAPGELCLRGHHIMKGYYKDSEATQKVIDDRGWFHTGDMATIDANGYVKINARLVDLVTRDGEFLFPREIEEFLYTYPKVMDAQVVGVPSKRHGEKLVAFIRLKPNASADLDEMLQFCNGRIANEKIPSHFLFVKEFPATASGKIQKFKLRQQAAEQIDNQ